MAKEEKVVVNVVVKGTKESAKSVKSFSASAVAGYAAVAAIAAKVGKEVADVVNTFKDFDETMSKVEAVAGATNEEMEMLSESAKNIGATTEKSAQQVAELQLNLSKLGFTVTEIDAVTSSIVDLSIASGEDLAKSAEVLGGVLNAFQLDASEASRVADVMASSFSNSALDLEKFKVGLGKVAPIANTVGLSIEETTAMIGVLSDNSIDAGTASAQLRNILLATQKAGISLTEAYDMINNASDPVVKAQELFGKQAAGVSVILAQQQGAVGDLTKTLQESEGAAADMAATMSDNLAGDMKKLTSAIEAFYIMLGEGNEGEMRQVVQTLTQMVDVIAKATEETSFLSEYFNIYKDMIGEILDPLMNLFDLFDGGVDAVDAVAIAMKSWLKVVEFMMLPLKAIFSIIGFIVDYITIMVEVFRDFDKLSPEQIFQKLLKAVVDLYSPITDLLGLTDKLNEKLGLTEKVAKKAVNGVKSYADELKEMQTEAKAIAGTYKNITQEGIDAIEKLMLADLRQTASFIDNLTEKAMQEAFFGGKSAEYVQQLIDYRVKQEEEMAEKILQIREDFYQDDDYTYDPFVEDSDSGVGSSVGLENKLKTIEEFEAELAKLTTEKYRLRQETLDKQYEEDRETYKDDKEKLLLIDKIYNQKSLQVAMDQGDEIIDNAQRVLDYQEQLAKERFDARLELGLEYYDAELEQLKNALEMKYITEEEYARKVAELDANRNRQKMEGELETAAQIASSISSILAGAKQFELENMAKTEEEKKAIQKKYALFEAASALSEIAIATALAVSKVMPNIPLAVLVGAAGAVQAGVVVAEKAKIASYGAGGYIDGNPHSNGGVNINAEGGEFINNKKSTSMFGGILSMLNDIGNGKSISVNNDNNKMIQTYVVADDMTEKQERAMYLKNKGRLFN